MFSVGCVPLPARKPGTLVHELYCDVCWGNYCKRCHFCPAFLTFYLISSIQTDLVSVPVPSLVLNPTCAATVAATAADRAPWVQLASLSSAKSGLLLFRSKQCKQRPYGGMKERMIGIAVDRWRECATDSQTVGTSWGRDLFCSPLLRFTVPLSHSFPCLLLSLLSPCFSLCLTFPWLGCDLFCSLLMLSVAILRGLTGYKDGQCVYTSLECGIASTLPWLSVCVCGG